MTPLRRGVFLFRGPAAQDLVRFSHMEHERGYNPDADREARAAAEKKLEDRLRETGDVDVDGVSEQDKDAFLESKIAEVAEQMAKLERVRRHLERLATERADARGGSRDKGFTVQEKEWFAEGNDPDRVALEASWETDMSLDIDDVPAEAKHAFAEEKLMQLRAALKAGRVKNAEAAMERLQRIELLRDQYAKLAEDEKGDVAAAG